MSDSPETHSFSVADDEAGVRLDKYLSERLPSLSRSRVQQLIAGGNVTLNGQTHDNPSAKTKVGEAYTLTIPPATPTELVATPMALDIIYEDEHLLVINKPAGLAVHPAPGHVDDTLVNGLLAHCPDSLSGIGGVERPGIVHRLDKDTSGLMVVAKHDQAHQHLSGQLQDRSLKRIYQAVVWGIPSPKEGTIDAAIGRSRHDRKKMAVVDHGGKDARTHYSVEQLFTLPVKDGRTPAASLVTCQLETGRTHQIRVHMTHLGHGLVGDPAYGASTASRLKGLGIKSDSISNIIMTFPRQALHAKHMAFIHPKSFKKLEFSSDLPKDMQALINTFSSD